MVDISRALVFMAALLLTACMVVSGVFLYLVTRWWLLLVLLWALALSN